MQNAVWMWALALLAPGCGGGSGEGAAAEEETGVVGAKDSPTSGYGKADGTATLGDGSFVVSASSVQALSGDLGSVRPAVDTPAGVEAYLSATSALGYAGPIGPYGPLGTLGPIGDNSWNVSAWMGAIGDWSDWSDEMTDHGGPLSEAGPLGPDGPLGDKAYSQDLPAINDFAKQLQAGGVWTVLGPLGPLGALGPLGPLGPVGAHGFEVDEDGAYRDSSQADTVRNTDIEYEGGVRSYGLFERYDDDFAAAMNDNDTSFMVEGTASGTWFSGFETDEFTFTSAAEQFVTVLLVPEYQLDDFDLDILNADGDVVAASKSSTLIDWVQIRVPAGTKLVARVKLYATGHILTKDYRLFVTGSTEHFADTDITGDHQVGR